MKSLIYGWVTLALSLVTAPASRANDSTSAELKEILARATNVAQIAVDDVSRWSPNISTGSEMQVNGEPNGGASIKISWGESTDGWCYPQYKLADPLSGQNAAVFRVKGEGSATIGFCAYFSNGQRYMASRRVPSDGDWYTVEIPLAELNSLDTPGETLDAEKIGQLAYVSIGVNAGPVNGGQVVVTISDLYLVQDPNF